MNTSDSIPPSLAGTLASYLEGLEEQGVEQVLLEHPFPAAPATPPPPRPRQQPAPVPPVDPVPEKPILPPTPRSEPVAATSEEKLVWCRLRRMEGCGDRVPAAESAVVLVTGKGETENEAGALLGRILRAAGYERDSGILPLDTPGDLRDAGSRILVMGNAALQEVSPAGMDLKIVRGMWQSTPYGKLISTHPPSALLPDDDAGKKAVWQDLKLLLKDLKLEIPDWSRKRTSTRASR